MSLAALIGMLLLCLVGGAGGGALLMHNYDENKRIAAEAQAEHDRMVAVAEAREEEQDRAQAASMQFETERQKLEDAYADARTKLRNKLQRPISCPPGLSLGDVVLPGDALHELRRAAGQDRAVPAAPGASESDR